MVRERWPILLTKNRGFRIVNLHDERSDPMQSRPSLKWWLVLGMCLMISLITTSALATKGTVTTDSLILRKEASTDSKALQTLDKGTTLNLKSVSGSWYKVSYGTYSGYVMKKYVKADGDVPEAKEKKDTKKEEPKKNETPKSTETIASLGDAPATSKPGDSGAKVKKLQKALNILGFYSGKIDGSYGKGTTDAVKAFQKKKGMSQDGVAGEATIKIMFDKKAANAGSAGNNTGKTNKAKDTTKKVYKTEMLNWFKDGVDVIPKNASFTVKDVYTGKTFTAERWSGSNHLDAEPATKSDTTTMKSIFGGWSWRRRPILVKYNGHVYAASMNGMPHGTDMISGNNFDGHFCIHFHKSKTHGTDKVDAVHQNCVDLAMKYTW